MAALEHPASSSVKLFVGNLPFEANSSTLEKLFLPFGQLIGAKVVLDRSTRKPRGFGFVTFEDDEAAEKALSMHGHDLKGRELTVRRAVARGTGSLKDDEDEDDVARTPLPPPLKAGVALCKFNATPGGCKNGNKCRFKHSMNEWSGPAVAVPEKPTLGKAKSGGSKPSAAAPKPVAPPLTEGAAVSAPSTTALVPRPALAVCAERLTFLMSKSKEGAPTVSQLGAFLRTVTTALVSTLTDKTESFDMSSIGWNFKTNSSIPGSKPPDLHAVEQWLRNPSYVPKKELTVKDFEARSRAPITKLLEEYGEFDPNWTPDVKAKAPNSK
jgi:hypothetical protein